MDKFQYSAKISAEIAGTIVSDVAVFLFTFRVYPVGETIPSQSTGSSELRRRLIDGDKAECDVTRKAAASGLFGVISSKC